MVGPPALVQRLIRSVAVFRLATVVRRHRPSWLLNSAFFTRLFVPVLLPALILLSTVAGLTGMLGRARLTVLARVTGGVLRRLTGRLRLAGLIGLLVFGRFIGLLVFGRFIGLLVLSLVLSRLSGLLVLVLITIGGPAWLTGLTVVTRRYRLTRVLVVAWPIGLRVPVWQARLLRTYVETWVIGLWGNLWVPVLNVVRAVVRLRGLRTLGALLSVVRPCSIVIQCWLTG